jgi:hypothetical protein
MANYCRAGIKSLRGTEVLKLLSVVHPVLYCKIDISKAIEKRFFVPACTLKCPFNVSL